MNHNKKIIASTRHPISSFWNITLECGHNLVEDIKDKHGNMQKFKFCDQCYLQHITTRG